MAEHKCVKFSTSFLSREGECEGKSKEVPDGCNVFRAAATAASECIDQPVLTEGPDLFRHLRPLLVVTPHGIGQASIGVAEDVAVCALAEVGDVLVHVRRTQSAVQADSKGLGMAHAVPEGLVSLPTQSPACKRSAHSSVSRICQQDLLALSFS